MNVNFASNSIVLANLTAHTLYVINVSAVSPGGLGPANTTTARTQAAGNIQVETELVFYPMLPLLPTIAQKEPLPSKTYQNCSVHIYLCHDEQPKAHFYYNCLSNALVRETF